MCLCSQPSRRDVLIGLAAGAILPPSLAFADDHSASDIAVIGGELSIDQPATSSTFTLKAGPQGGVMRARDQIFYLDPDAEADFYKTDDGLMGQVIIKTGGILSLFGPEQGKNTVIKTPNAVGAIRGTTTYFAWQDDAQESYICCCYGGVDLAYQSGRTLEMRTQYHNAVVVPMDGQIVPAPYGSPLNHFDDDIIALEKVAGRAPRWVLPNDKPNFIAPRSVPITG